MMKAFAEDFRFAQTTGVCMKVHLLTGEELLTGVHQVNKDGGYVSLFAPVTFGDNTTRKVDMDLVASVSVTDVVWT